MGDISGTSMGHQTGIPVMGAPAGYRGITDGRPRAPTGAHGCQRATAGARGTSRWRPEYPMTTKLGRRTVLGYRVRPWERSRAPADSRGIPWAQPRVTAKKHDSNAHLPGKVEEGQKVDELE